VDGNVVRVASRLWGLRGDGRTPRFRQAIARRLAAAMDAAAPGDFNQALMELGARVCRPRRPACPDCPLADDCHARAAGRPERWPPRRPRVRTPHIHVAVGLVRRRGRLLIAKRRLDQMLGGLWELPGGKVQPGETPAQAVVREIREEVGLAVRVADALPPVRHAYSHFSITLHAFECRTGPGKATAIVPAAVLWVAPARLAEFAFPAARSSPLPQPPRRPPAPPRAREPRA